MNQLRIALPENQQNVKNYLAALKCLGADVVVVSSPEVNCKSACQQEYLDIRDLRAQNYDGLLLPGGWDVNPSLYGAEKQGTGYTDDALDQLQLGALDQFAKEKKPIFGICRGLQLINVYFGGSLFQHLATARRHAKRSAEEPDRLHLVTASRASWLEGLYGSEFVCNSAHHQAAARLGQGLAADSWCKEDQVVEALHHVSLPIWGVQWHPERLSLDWARPEAVEGLKVLEFFLLQCRCRASQRVWEGEMDVMI